MGVMHLWAIGIGAAAVALPVAIHFLTKPRPVRLEISTLRFISGALHEQRARHRLRDFIILGLRTAAVALAAAAFARPFLGTADAAADSSAAIRVIMIDASQSMAAADNGIPAFERARGVAAEQMTYRPGLSANLIVATSRPAATFTMPSSNFAALRDDLARAAVSHEALDVNAALARAATMFDERLGQRQELVIVSDFQRTSWSKADFSVVPADVRVLFESVASTKPLENMGLASATIRDRTTADEAVTVEIEAVNNSPVGRTIDVELKLGDAVRRLQASCGPYARETLSTEIPMPASEWQWGTATIVGSKDSLADDDTLPLVARVRRAPAMALLTRQPARMRPSSSYFLTTAIAPVAPHGGVPPHDGVTPTGSPSRLVRIDPSRGEPETVSSADVIVIDRPGLLGEEWIAQLLAAARRGRVVFYVAEEPADATNLQRLADTAGRDWRFPVDFSPPLRGRRAADVFIDDVAGNRPPFAVFGDELATVLAPLRFRSGLVTTARPGGLGDDILARYSDRTVCLAIGSVGSGRLAVLNADLAASHLARTEAFVPLIGELIDSLLDDSGGPPVVVCGQPMTAYLPIDVGPAAALELLGPESAAKGRLRDDPLGVYWETPPTRIPGVYRVTRDAATVFAAAAVVPAAEGDLRSLPEDVLTERLAGGRTTVYRAATSREPADRSWVWLATLCVACMLAEVLALKWFRA
jgi:hypothetical protein